MNDTSDKKKKTTAFRFHKVELLNIRMDDPFEFALLRFLCLAADNDDGTSFHSHASIEYATGLSEKSTQRTAKRLVQRGIISCEVRSRQETKLFTVHYDRLRELVDEAGRKKFILAQQEKDAARQRLRRSRLGNLVTAFMTVIRGAKEYRVPVTVTVTTKAKTDVVAVPQTATKEVKDEPVAVPQVVCSSLMGERVAVSQVVCSSLGDWVTTKEHAKTPTAKEQGASAPENLYGSSGEGTRTVTSRNEASGPISGLVEKLKDLEARMEKMRKDNSSDQKDVAAFVMLALQFKNCTAELKNARARQRAIETTPLP